MKIPNPDLLAEIRATQRCEWCGRRGPVDVEHTYARGLGDARRIDSRLVCMALCREHHSIAGSGHGEPSKAQLKALIAKREGVSEEAIREWVQTVNRTPKEGPAPPEPRRVPVEYALDCTKREVSF